MAGGRPEGQYSEDEDTDTDEYKEAKARCVLRLLLNPPIPFTIPIGTCRVDGIRVTDG